MSPYGGSIPKPERTGGPLVPRTYKLANSQALTVFPVSRETVPDGLLAYLQTVFNDVVEEGRTYPQMNPLSLDEFVRFPLPLSLPTEIVPEVGIRFADSRSLDSLEIRRPTSSVRHDRPAPAEEGRADALDPVLSQPRIALSASSTLRRQTWAMRQPEWTGRKVSSWRASSRDGNGRTA